MKPEKNTEDRHVNTEERQKSFKTKDWRDFRKNAHPENNETPEENYQPPKENNQPPKEKKPDKMETLINLLTQQSTQFNQMMQTLNGLIALITQLLSNQNSK